MHNYVVVLDVPPTVLFAYFLRSFLGKLQLVSFFFNSFVFFTHNYGEERLQYCSHTTPLTCSPPSLPPFPSRRGLSALLFLASVGAMAAMIYASCADISSYPFRTVSSINLTSPMAFPALTVCNINPIDLSTLSPTRAHWLDLLMADPSLMENMSAEWSHYHAGTNSL